MLISLDYKTRKDFPDLFLSLKTTHGWFCCICLCYNRSLCSVNSSSKNLMSKPHLKTLAGLPSGPFSHSMRLVVSVLGWKMTLQLSPADSSRTTRQSLATPHSKKPARRLVLNCSRFSFFPFF